MSVFVSVTARRVVAAVATAVAVVGAAALPASAADHDHDRGHGRSHRPPVVISDVQHRPSDRRDVRGPAERPLNREWVELANEGRESVDLDGWTLSDEDGHTYRFRHYRLGGHRSVRVHTGYGRDRGDDLYQDLRRSVWDRDHDTATLRDERGRLVDVASWGHDHRGDRGRHDGRWHGRHR
ncbi:lamin tail domain-containing protein [Streptomyces sp. NRRL B-3648]|uniref:lamin tail domain-containing protein n=1 Tax=Streptomyces sp. NRRL B-3648 TaxID=1519493 RepID=UPI00099BAD4A|nr:lamin tail domain-containing protein [Streptomyces sp. NRRL B-3648]